MDEERLESMREVVHTRAKEKHISLFEAASELAHETWDYDEEEIYNLWRAELLPRKQPRNPLQRLSKYLAERHPYLGWIAFAGLGMALGATALKPGYGFIFYPVAGFLLLWLISHREIAAEFFYTFRPYNVWVDRHASKMHLAMVDDLVTLGHSLEEAENAADAFTAEFRSDMLRNRQGK